jgi:hypothetical protein
MQVTPCAKDDATWQRATNLRATWYDGWMAMDGLQQK